MRTVLFQTDFLKGKLMGNEGVLNPNPRVPLASLNMFSVQCHKDKSITADHS